MSCFMAMTGILASSALLLSGCNDHATATPRANRSSADGVLVRRSVPRTDPANLQWNGGNWDRMTWE